MQPVISVLRKTVGDDVITERKYTLNQLSFSGWCGRLLGPYVPLPDSPENIHGDDKHRQLPYARLWVDAS